MEFENFVYAKSHEISSVFIPWRIVMGSLTNFLLNDFFEKSRGNWKMLELLWISCRSSTGLFWQVKAALQHHITCGKKVGHLSTHPQQGKEANPGPMRVLWLFHCMTVSKRQQTVDKCDRLPQFFCSNLFPSMLRWFSKLPSGFWQKGS